MRVGSVDGIIKFFEGTEFCLRFLLTINSLHQIKTEDSIVKKCVSHANAPDFTIRNAVLVPLMSPEALQG